MIDEKIFNKYEKALSYNADTVKAAILALESEFEGFSGAKLQTALNSTYAALVKQYGRNAAACALEFYTQTREGIQETYEARIYMPKNDELLKNDVSSFLQVAKDVHGVFLNLGNKSVQRVYEYADETLTLNSRFDPAKPKYALVPHAGACAWCIMIGGLGFQYNSASTLNKSRHSNCKCVPVVDFDTDNPCLKGYSPDGMAKRYNECQKTVFGDKNPHDEWEKLSKEEQNKYKNYDHWKRNKTIAEMATRDADWLRTGKVPEVTFETKKT